MSYFKVQKAVPKQIYDKLGDLSIRLIDQKIINIYEYLCRLYEVEIEANDWYKSGKFEGRGLRCAGMPDFRLYNGLPISLQCHSYGRALDIDIPGIKSHTVQDCIVKNMVVNGDLKKLGLTGIENDTDGWTHISVSCFDGWNIPYLNGLYLIPVK